MKNGILAGLAATIALSFLMYLKGMMAPVMTLMLHLIFGAVLGYTYNRLAQS